MITTMATCLGSEHRKLDQLNVQLAFAATRLAGDPEAVAADRRALEVWEEIRRDLLTHLQIEDELVLIWGKPRNAISGALLDAVKIEHQEVRKLVAGLPMLWSGVDRRPQTAGDRVAFARTLLAFTRTLDSHVSATKVKSCLQYSVRSSPDRAPSSRASSAFRSSTIPGRSAASESHADRNCFTLNCSQDSPDGRTPAARKSARFIVCTPKERRPEEIV
jgi:hypothetical protein